MALQRRLQHRVDRLQVAQQRQVRVPVEPAAQQGRDQGAAFDVDVQRAGLDLQPFGKTQRQGLSRRSIASIISRPAGAAGVRCRGAGP
jgi:hypothetical protein